MVMGAVVEMVVVEVVMGAVVMVAAVVAVVAREELPPKRHTSSKASFRSWVSLVFVLVF